MSKETYKVFKALGNPKRLKILEVLFKKDNLSVEEISKRIDSSYKSTSKHLLILEGTNLIKRKQNKWWGFYRLDESKKGNLKKILKMVKEMP